MAPFLIVALVSGSLFGAGTYVKPDHPALGTALQGAAIGTLAGGALGAAAGTASGTASVLGVVEADVVTTAAIAGGAAGTLGAVAITPSVAATKGKKKVVVIGQ